MPEIYRTKLAFASKARFSDRGRDRGFVGKGCQPRWATTLRWVMAEPAWLKQTPAGLELRIKVVPGSRSSAVAGALGDRLKVRVAQPPEDGKANAGVLRLIAEVLGISPASIELVQGHTRAEKTLRVQGIDGPAAQQRLMGGNA